MKIFKDSYWKNVSRDYVEYNKIKYVREEVKMSGDFHTIEWNIKIPDENKREDGPFHYFCHDMGWDGDDGLLNKNNPPPELEVEFQKLKLSERDKMEILLKHFRNSVHDDNITELLYNDELLQTWLDEKLKFINS